MTTLDVTRTLGLYAFSTFPSNNKEGLDSKTEAKETNEPLEPAPRMRTLPKPDFDFNMIQSAQVQRNVNEDFVRSILDSSVVGSGDFLVELSKLPKGEGKDQLFADYLQKFGYVLSTPFGETEGESFLAAVLQNVVGILSPVELQEKMNSLKKEILQGIEDHWEVLKIEYSEEIFKGIKDYGERLSDYLKPDGSVDCEAYCGMIKQKNLWGEPLAWNRLLNILRNQDITKNVVLSNFTTAEIKSTTLYDLDENGLLIAHGGQVRQNILEGTGPEQYVINILHNPSRKNFQALISPKEMQQLRASEVKADEIEPAPSKGTKRKLETIKDTSNIPVGKESDEKKSTFKKPCRQPRKGKENI